MKTILISIAIFFCCSAYKAQSSEQSSIAIHVYIDSKGFKDCQGAGQVLEGKLTGLINSSGMSGRNGGRFFLIPKLTVLSTSQSSTPSGAATVIADIALSLYICDNSDEKVINSVYLEYRGVGANKEDAILRAAKKFDSKNPELKSFVEEARKRIYEYYQTYCSSIIQKASSTSVTNIHKALEDLSMIPPQNKDCYDEAQIQIHMLYSHYLDKQCQEAISKARLIWATYYNSESAWQAMEHLKQATLTADCRKEVKDLSEEMRARVEKNEEFEKELTRLVLESENRKMELDAEILKEIIRNQPQQVYNTEFIFVD